MELRIETVKHPFTATDMSSPERYRHARATLGPGTLNEYSAVCHSENKRWWEDVQTGEPIERNRGELLMLIVSEVAEAMEGARKGIPDDKLPHRSMEEVELADALIRIFDYAGAYGLDLEGALAEKLIYNRQREDHTHEARRQAGGKRF